MYDDILDKILVDKDTYKIPWDNWCHYKKLAFDLKENCPDSHFGLCLYTILFEHDYASARFFKSFGYKILKANSMDNDLIDRFVDKYVDDKFYGY